MIMTPTMLEKVLMTLMNEVVERISDQHFIFHLDTKYKEKLENKQFDSIWPDNIWLSALLFVRPINFANTDDSSSVFFHIH